MRRFRLLPLLALLLLSSPSAATGLPSAPADTVQKGIVWTPPADRGPILRGLRALRATGATTLRLTRPPASEVLYAAADTMGLSLYVDLPVGPACSTALADSLAAVTGTLDRLQAQARAHPSLQSVGLSGPLDTTAPSTCTALSEWTDRVHRQSELSTYYSTPFASEADRCADAVDRVLVDLRSTTTPLARWDAWTRTASNAAIGALGTWVHPEAREGLRIPHSPQRQARYLERHLNALLDSTEAQPGALFVHRWRDASDAALSPRQYGLHTAEGTARPAARVVSGIYRSTQRVFAFPVGTAPSGSAPYGLVLLGWGMVALLAGLYGQNTYVRQTLARYFTAHGFYRDAVREGRDISTGANGLLFGLIGAALGIIGTLALQISAPQPATGFVVEALPSPLQAPAVHALTHPLTGGLIVGGGTLALLLLWTLVLTGVAQQWNPFSFDQALTLMVWPCWPALPGVVVALVAATRPPVSPGLLGGVLLIGGGLTLVAVTVRVLRDYAAITDVPLALIPLLALPSPLLVVTLLLVGLTARYDVPLSLLYSLVMQT